MAFVWHRRACDFLPQLCTATRALTLQSSHPHLAIQHVDDVYAVKLSMCPRVLIKLYVVAYNGTSRLNLQFCSL
ncbi:hypothetical protein T440DRAFT_473054 [Plenodomus tracheiphilus IPT5]|uniref:Uncharacterized protein n=1 Tax=Plenodomus tracheiphilus IPT5 TaxID=1408161 RepID=A0A6A7ARA4_9PLEO|nr:hypothetical protein T440DRAFT_473054 [Plenodomus tracheiphilus IPT5]